jgi:hypothetical protein
MAAENELFIYLRFMAEEAEAASRAYHHGEQQRIHQTAIADEQTTKERNAARRKALDEAVQMSRAAQKDLEDIAKRAIKDDKERAAAQLKQAKDSQAAKLKGEKDFADKQKQSLREVAKLKADTAKQDLADDKLVAKAVADSKKNEVRTAQDAARAKASIAKDSANAEKRATSELEAAWKKAMADEVRDTEQALSKQTADRKQAFREWKQDHENAHKLAMMEWAAETKANEDALRKQTRDQSDAVKARASIAKDFAAAEKRADAELEAAFRKVKQAEVNETRQALRQQTSDQRQAFREWKQEHDNQHKLAMMNWAEQQKSIKATEQATFSSAAALGTYAAGFASLGTAKTVLSAIVTQLSAASDFTKETARNFIELRKSMQQVAALKDKQNDAKFTMQEVEKAKAAGLMPDEWRGFQEEFQSYAGAQLEGPDKKLDEKQAEEYQSRIAKFMKTEGIDPKLGAELGGTLLENSKGPQNVDNLMDRYGKAYETLKKSRTPVAQLLPQVARVAAYGVSPEEASQLLSVIAPAMPREEQTGVENTFRAIQELKTAGKGEEFGIKKGMTKFEEVKALSKAVAERMKKGEDPAEFLKEAKIGDMRQLRGIQGLARYGVELGGFDRFARYAKDLPADHTNQAAKRFDASENGQQVAREADRAAALAQTGADDRRLEELRHEAETQLIKEGRFKKATVGDVVRGTVGSLTGVPVREQLINERSVLLARQRANYDPMRTKGVSGAAGVSGHETTAVVNEGLRILLERQIKLQEEANAIAKRIADKKEARPAQVQPPLPARPQVQAR